MAWNPAATGAGGAASAAIPWIGLASTVIGAAKGTPAGPSQANQSTQIGIDFSDWTVATGGGNKVEGSTDATGFSISPYLMLAVAGLAIVLWTKKSKG